jgi:aerotaxis receptor
MNKATQEQKELNMDIELISITDLDGIITYANEALCLATGYKHDELVGKKAKSLNHVDMPKAAISNLKHKLKARKVWRGAVKKVGLGNQYFWVKEIITPIYENSSIVAFQSVCKPLQEEHIENAVKIYLEINESNSIFYMWENFYYRFGFYSIIALTIFIISFFVISANYFYTIIPIVIYYCELSKSTTFFESLTGNFDDVTRFIFSKNKEADLLKMNEKSINNC